MKKTIENREDLLRNLALKGDSHAFFSLSAPYLRARYLRERSTGASHLDAQTRVLAEATDLLEKLQHVAPGRIDAWFEEHCMMIASPDSDLPENVTDTKIFAETASFLSRCSSNLLSSSSKMKQLRQRHARSFPQNLFHNRIVAIIFITALAIGLGYAGTLVMTLFKASVSLSFETPDRHFSFRIPPATSNNDGATTATPYSTVDTAKSKKALSEGPSPNTGAISSTTTNLPPRPTQQPTTTQPPTPSAATRSLPPIVPKARMVLPPTPPQPVDPSTMSATPSGDDPSLPQEAAQPPPSSVGTIPGN